MDEIYDDNAFYVFLIAMSVLYLIGASIYLVLKYKSVRAAQAKQEASRDEASTSDKIDLDKIEEKPITFGLFFYLNIVGVVVAIILLSYLSGVVSHEEEDIFDPYSILELSIGASDKDIKRAYRKLALLYHPDKPTGDMIKFQLIEKAYRALSDEVARRNWEQYGNPDGPTTVTMGIGLPEWIVKGKGQLVFIILYIILFLVAVPFIVKYFHKKNESVETKKKGIQISKETIKRYYLALNESIPLSSIPEIFCSAEEFGHLFSRQHYDSELVNYYNAMNPPKDKDDHLSVNKMKKPKIPLEMLSKDGEEFSQLKCNILLHAYLNNITLSEQHEQDLLRFFVLAKDLYIGLLQAAYLPRNNRPPMYSTLSPVFRFIQCVHQGIWIRDSHLKQLPYITDDQISKFRNKSNEDDIMAYIKMDPEKRRSNKNITPDQQMELNKAMLALPRLTLKAHFETEGEKTIVAGDLISLILEVEHDNIPIPEDKKIEIVKEEEEEEKKEREEEEEDKKEEEFIDEGEPIEVNEEEEEEVEKNKEEYHYEGEVVNKPIEATFEYNDDGTVNIDSIMIPDVYSFKYPFVLHESWYIVLCDPTDKVVYRLGEIENQHRNFVDTSLKISFDEPNTYVFNAHFICMDYLGCDLSFPIAVTVLPQSAAREDLDKEEELEEVPESKGFFDSLLPKNEEEDDDDWNSDDEEEEEKKKKEEEKKKRTAPKKRPNALSRIRAPETATVSTATNNDTRAVKEEEPEAKPMSRKDRRKIELLQKKEEKKKAKIHQKMN
ncbi:hypothetical protein WA158_001643 [Blastocystis sp. Blastoise]